MNTDNEKYVVTVSPASAYPTVRVSGVMFSRGVLQEMQAAQITPTMRQSAFLQIKPLTAADAPRADTPPRGRKKKT